MVPLHAQNRTARAGDLRVCPPASPVRLSPGPKHAHGAEAYQERVGVCRDFTHLAITFCRCLNIPARYCTGYVGDIGVPPASEPVDFSAWFEAFLGGDWCPFDPRHNAPRIGRVLMDRGRDAADVTLLTSFGPSRLERFTVWTEAVSADAPRPAAKPAGRA